MTVKDINEIIKIVCPNDEDYKKPIISPKYLRQELEQLALEQEHRHLDQEPITKNDLGVKHHKQNIQAYAHDFGVSEEQAETELRVTKNDLGVDCIPRIEVIDYLCKHCPDDGECFKDCDEIKHLRQMPSVTPQEPKPMVEIDLYSVIKQKYIEREVLDEIRAEIERLQKMCDKNDLNLMAQYSAFGMVLDILDKYKAESEVDK